MSEKSSKTKGSLGLLSLISIIAGTVIGSGIYVKNGSLMDIANSSILIVVGWLVAGLLVVSILIAFFEINSIVNRGKSTQSLPNYALFLFSPRASRMMAIYYIFLYFPYMVAGKSVFVSNKLFANISGLGGINEYAGWAMMTVVSLLVIISIVALLLYTLRGTKTAITTGTFVKLLPLLMIIVMMALVGFGLNFGEVEKYNSIFDPNAAINSGLGENSVMNFFLILPPIMFTFDGFLLANSLSGEAKSKSTMKRASIIAMMIVILVYLLFSISTLLLSPNGDYEITSITHSLFPSAPIVADLVLVAIIISIMSSALATAFTNLYMTSTSSLTNQLVDRDGEFLKRSKTTMPYNAIKMFFVIAISWLFVLRLFDLFGILLLDGAEALFYYGMTNYITNMSTTINFVIYGILIAGAMNNRRTKRFESDRGKSFYPASIFAISLITIITVFNVYDIFNELFLAGDQLKGALELGILIVFIGSIVGIIIANELRFKKYGTLISERKQILIQAYDDFIPYSEIDFDYEEQKLKNREN